MLLAQLLELPAPPIEDVRPWVSARWARTLALPEPETYPAAAEPLETLLLDESWVPRSLHVAEVIRSIIIPRALSESIAENDTIQLVPDETY
jgi:hypothetical protein